jgi:hypothetical protein
LINLSLEIFTRILLLPGILDDPAVDDFVKFGIFESLIQIIETYAVKYTRLKENDNINFNKNTNTISSVFFIISELISSQTYTVNIFTDECIPKFIAAGLLNCIVKIYDSPIFCDKIFTPNVCDVHINVCFIDVFLNMVKSLCVFDVKIIQQFRLLGILSNSDFFSALPADLRSHVFVLM